MEELTTNVEGTVPVQPEEIKWYKSVSYEDAKVFIKSNIASAARSFIAIGYYLKLVRDKEMYREDGHETIWDFAKAEYGISQSTASRYMSMNDRFSKDGNSPIIRDEYKEFGKSQLQEMLSLTDEQVEQVRPKMCIRDSLKAQLKSEWGGELRITTKHYFIERKDVEEDIKYLIEAERRFWDCVVEGRRPDLILPAI